MILLGDCRDFLPTLDDESVQCVVTSPPYWNLRDYGVPGQIGLEKTVDEYVRTMVEVFREVRRVLRKDGTLWLNLGDSYSAGGNGGHGSGSGSFHGHKCRGVVDLKGTPKKTPGYAAKQLLGIPWRVALALQADGWYLRSDIIWHKPNPMPESVKDRPTKAHEYLFLFAKSERYYYDYEAIKEPVAHDPTNPRNRWDTKDYKIPGQKPQKRLNRKNGNHRTGGPRPSEIGHAGKPHHSGLSKLSSHGMRADGSPWGTRNKRTVWTIASRPFKGAHFATFPAALVEPCIMAGTRPGDTVLDPFLGSGTVGEVAGFFGRKFIGIELNPEYEPMAADRMTVRGLEL